MAAALVFLIWLGRATGRYDPGGREFPEVQDRHLTVTGTVAVREAYADGFGIYLNSISFLSDQSESYRDTILRLNKRLHPSDQIKITLERTDLFEQLHAGDKVVLRGICAQPQKASNPGQFDQRSYYHARNIYVMMRGAELKERCAPERSAGFVLYAFRDCVCDIRYRMQRALVTVFGQEDASVIAAALLGDRSALSEEKKQFFRDGGMAFLLTVSSLHITLFGKFLYRLLRRLGRSFIFSSVFSLCGALTYVLLSGGSFSAQRASIMLAFWLGAQITGRTEDRLTSLGGAAVLILIQYPCALYDSSFQISCVCVLSMELVPPSLCRLIRPGRDRSGISGKIPRALSGFITMAGTQIGLVPVLLYRFYQITPYASVLHLLLLPAASLLSAFGIPGILCGLFLFVRMPVYLRPAFYIAGRLLAGPCHYLVTFFMILCRLEQELPGSVLILGRPAPAQMILYYGILALSLILIRKTDKNVLKRHRKRIGILCGILPVLLIALLVYRRRPAFRFTCLDVGQGSCGLIEYGDFVCLFDAGSSSVSDVWQYRISSTLKYYGISEVDMVFLSHGDLDHVNGMEQMLGMYHRNLTGRNAGDVTVGEIIFPDLPQEDQRLTEVGHLARQNGIPVGFVSEGDILRYGEMTMNVLNPSAGRITGDANQDCIVLYVTCGNLRILLTGDLEKEGEDLFANRYGQTLGICEEDTTEAGEHVSGEGTKNPFRVLVAGHHGSGNATSEKLLGMVRPDLVLISCGRNNRYGHPAPSMLERLREYGTQWKRTDLDGACSIIIE